MSKKIFISIIVLLFAITIFCQRVEASAPTDLDVLYNSLYERFYGKQDSLQTSELISIYISDIESCMKSMSSEQYYCSDYYHFNIIPILIIDDKIYIAWETDLEEYANDLNSIKQQIENSEDNYFVKFYYSSQRYICIIEINKDLEGDNETPRYSTVQTNNKINIIFSRITKIIGNDINKGQFLYLSSIKPDEVKYEIKSNSILDIIEAYVPEYDSNLDKIEQNAAEHYKVTCKYDSNGKVEMIEFSRYYSVKTLIIAITLIIVLTIVCIIVFKCIKKHIKK